MVAVKPATSGANSHVFVRGFDFGTTEAQIKAHMVAAGSVKKVEMWGRGAAVVTYGSPAAAKKAVSELNESVIDGNSRFIDVKIDQKEGESAGEKRKASSRASGPSGAPSCRVFVRGFDFGTTDEQLEAHMSQAGEITKVQWASKGSAVVHYGSTEEAQAAVESLNQTIMDGNSRYIDVILKEDNDGGGPPKKKAKSGGKGDGGWMMVPQQMVAMFNMMKGGQMQGKGKAKAKAKGKSGGGRSGSKGDDDPPGSGRVFVRGFDFGTTDEQLEEHMSQAGEIHSVHWCTKGSAIVVYTDKSSAEEALSQLNNTVIDGNERYIDILEK